MNYTFKQRLWLKIKHFFFPRKNLLLKGEFIMGVLPNKPDYIVPIVFKRTN